MALENIAADLRYAVRTLRHSPAFAIAAAATLALGIGANTAIFSVVNAVFLRPLPYVQSDRLVWATEFFPKFKRDQVFAPEFDAWRKQSTAFERLEGYGIGIGVNLASENRIAERVHAGHVTPGFFAMLGVEPEIGRSLSSADDHLAILSDALWRNSFQADRNILGKHVALNGVDYTVIGVMPSGFVDPSAADTGVWLPDAVTAKSIVPGRGMGFLGGVIGRLKPGVTPDSARANLEVVARNMDAQYPAPWSSSHAAAHVRVLPLQQQLTANSKTLLSILMGAVGFILLIACANVANMFLSRTVARRKELAVRAAIGATRSRLAQLLLAESLVVALIGGVAGTALMLWSISALAFLMPAAIPRHVPIDARVLAFALLCSVATSILFGLAPAFRLGNISNRRRPFSFRGALTTLQIAFSLVLLIGAGLLARSFATLMSVNPGFNPRNVLVAELSLAPVQLYGPSQQADFFRRALDVTQRIPGVESAAVTDESPLVTFQSLASGVAAEGHPPSDAIVVPVSISPAYFHALRIPLLEGRDFDNRDREGAPQVAILNRRLARLLFAGADPIGRRIRMSDKDPWLTVVGITADIRHRSLDDRVWPELYQPFEQAPTPWMTFVIKTATDPQALIPSVRKAIASIDRNQPLFDIESLETRLSDSVAQRRERAFLLGGFAFLALAIAVAGIYGVMSYSVARRTQEIGVRMALGARRSGIIALVLSEGMRLAIAGVALGVAGAMALTRVLASFLYGIRASDPTTFVSAGLLLITAACVAVYIPARRATRVDPMTALRHD